jgi:small basic protein (TIGR04137 family)
MSLHKSLKLRNLLQRRRNVLTRHERLERLKSQGRLDPEQDSVFGLPKVKVQATVIRKTKKRQKPGEGEGEAGAGAGKGEQ